MSETTSRESNKRATRYIVKVHRGKPAEPAPAEPNGVARRRRLNQRAWELSPRAHLVKTTAMILQLLSANAGSVREGDCESKRAVEQGFRSLPARLVIEALGEGATPELANWFINDLVRRGVIQDSGLAPIPGVDGSKGRSRYFRLAPSLLKQINEASKAQGQAAESDPLSGSRHASSLMSAFS